MIQKPLPPTQKKLRRHAAGGAGGAAEEDRNGGHIGGACYASFSAISMPSGASGPTGMKSKSIAPLDERERCECGVGAFNFQFNPLTRCVDKTALSWTRRYLCLGHVSCPGRFFALSTAI